MHTNSNKERLEQLTSEILANLPRPPASPEEEHKIWRQTETLFNLTDPGVDLSTHSCRIIHSSLIHHLPLG